MKKVLLVALLFAASSYAGVYSDLAKAKFENEMSQAINLTDMSDAKKQSAIANLPSAEKTLRNVAREGIKAKKSCLKIKKDFMSDQRQKMKGEQWKDEDFSATALSAMGDYIATVCLDMR